MPPAWMRAAARVDVLLALLAAVSAACGVFGPRYEYEEELYLSLDGAATLNVNASVAALAARRAIDRNLALVGPVAE